MKITLGTKVTNPEMDDSDDVKLYIAGQFIGSWNKTTIPILEKIYNDPEVYSWFCTLMEIAVEKGIQIGWKQQQNAMREMIGLPKLEK